MSTGNIGQKVLQMGSQLPYGADEQAITYYGSTNNIHTMVFKLATVTVKTRTFSYAGEGAADNDQLTGFIDT